jgi:hypothetical protein
MKKLLLSIALLIPAIAAFAQQPYNGSFNTWYSPTNPDGWGTWATAIGQYNGVLGDSLIRLCRKDSLDSAPYLHDTTSVRMTVDTITLPSQGQVTLAGFISYGGAFYVPPPDTAPGLYFGYYPYGQFPDSLILDYKYIPAPGTTDSALVIMTMNRFDSVTQSEIFFLSTSWLLMPVDSWTHVAFKLNYQPYDTFTYPDSIQIIVLSSINQLHRGTTLWVDSIHFDASVEIINGITDMQNIRGVKAYPNPANAQLNILVQQSEIGSGIELYDAEGRRAYSDKISSTLSTIDTRCLPAGIYTLRVHSTDRLTIYTGHITVAH